MASEQQPVPGDNPAYFSGSTPPSEQLFQIEEFVLAPIPPPINHRFFGYIRGFLPNLPNVDNASLKLSGKKDDEEQRDYVDKLSNWPQIIFRHKHQYSHELKPGMNEIIADYILISTFIETGNYIWLQRRLFLMDASCFA